MTNRKFNLNNLYVNANPVLGATALVLVATITLFTLTGCNEGGGSNVQKSKSSSNGQVAANQNADMEPSTQGIKGSNRSPAYVGQVQQPSGQLPSGMANTVGGINPPLPAVNYPPVISGGPSIPGTPGAPGSPAGSAQNTNSTETTQNTSLPAEIVPGCRSGNYYQSLHAVLNSQGACVIGARYNGNDYVTSSGNRMPPGPSSLGISEDQNGIRKLTIGDPCPSGSGNKYIVEICNMDLGGCGSGWTVGHVAGTGAVCPLPNQWSNNLAERGNAVSNGSASSPGWKALPVSMNKVVTLPAGIPTDKIRVRVQIMNKTGAQSGFGNCLGACSYTYWRTAYLPQQLPEQLP